MTISVVKQDPHTCFFNKTLKEKMTASVVKQEPHTCFVNKTLKEE